MQNAERWGVFEISAKGCSGGNPYTDYQVKGVFKGTNEEAEIDGFYDGDGTYKVRFMPSFEGVYSYEITSKAFDSVISGEFLAMPPSEGNHGPVRVANTYHFAYEDGMPYYSVGTTCYVWELQPDEIRTETLKELSKGYFNKIRFCIFPKHYDYNLAEPEAYPYELGNREGLNEDAVSNYPDLYPPVEKPDMNFNFLRFNPEYFKHIDKCIAKLCELGIQADIIVMHPYDRWGFSKMTKEADTLYWNYIVARYSAYRNVWWSLANEYDILKWKSLEDWEDYAAILCRKDKYKHLRSVHNCGAFYDGPG